jgi:hypothetical protein
MQVVTSASVSNKIPAAAITTSHCCMLLCYCYCCVLCGIQRIHFIISSTGKQLVSSNKLKIWHLRIRRHPPDTWASTASPRSNTTTITTSVPFCNTRQTAQLPVGAAGVSQWRCYEVSAYHFSLFELPTS